MEMTTFARWPLGVHPDGKSRALLGIADTTFRRFSTERAHPATSDTGLLHFKSRMLYH